MDADVLARYRRLLAAVIMQAIKDACEPPICRRRANQPHEMTLQDVIKRYQQRQRERRAMDAVRWLLDPASTCSLYAGLIGLDVDALRERLRAAARSGRRYLADDGTPLDMSRFWRRLKALQQGEGHV